MTKEEIGDLIEQLQSEHYAQGMDADDFIQELINRAIAIERERIIKANAPEIEKVNAYIKALAESADSATDFVEPVAWIEKHKDYLAVSADPFENAIPVYTAPSQTEQKTPLKVLNLTVFTENRLRNGRVYDVETLQAMTNRDILAIPDMGKKALAEVLEALAKLKEKNG